MRFRIVTAQSSSVDGDGFWGVQSDAHGKDSALGHFWMMHPFGFISRPVDPANDTGKGCYLLEATDGSSEGFSWLCHDPRYQANIPALTQGSSCQYNSLGSFVFLDSDAENISTLSRYHENGVVKEHICINGKASDGTPTIELRHGDGQYISMRGQKIVLRAKGNASIALDGNNVEVNGNMNNAGAGSFGGATPANGLVPTIGFEAFVAALVASLTPIATPITGSALASAITAALTATQAGLKTQYLSAL